MAEDRHFQCVQRPSGVAIADSRPVRNRFLRDLDPQRGESSFVTNRAMDQDRNVLLGQRLEAEDAGSAVQRAVDGEIGVFRRGPNQCNHAPLHVRQQHVLLVAGESVDLVQEQDRSPAGGFEPRLALLEYPANLLDADRRRLGPLERPAGVTGDDLGQGGLPGSGRAPEDHRGQAVGVEHPAQKLAIAQEMLLTNKLSQVPRLHSRRQRLNRRQVFPGFLFPKCSHRSIVGGSGGRLPALGWPWAGLETFAIGDWGDFRARSCSVGDNADPQRRSSRRTPSATTRGA